MTDVKILYEDQDIFVVVKPAGMPSQGDRSSVMDMVSWLKNNLAKKGNKTPYVAVVHRLDRPVGGVMVYAKTKRAAAGLSAQIQKNQMTKKYRVVLTGAPEETKGVYEDMLLKDERSNTSKVVQAQTPGAKRAKLSYEVLTQVEEEGCKYTLAEVLLETGRHHQIRVQMAAHGAGVYGDTKYNPLYQNRKGWFDMGLFSCCLAFKHPVTGKKLAFEYIPETKPFTLFI